MTRLFPKEIIDHSQEKNFARHSVTSQVIYLTIVISLLLMIALMPLINVDVGVRSLGLVRPVLDIVTIHSPVSGQIEYLNVSENIQIQKGETIAVIEAPELDEQLRYNITQRNKLHKFLDDLKLLGDQNASTIISGLPLQSTRYLQSWLEFRQQLFNKKQQLERLARIYDRKQVLYNRKAISQVKLEEAMFSLREAEGQYQLLVEQQQYHWQQERITYQNKLDELESEHQRLQQELRRYKLRSPITGTVQNLSGLLQNNFVQANQVLGEISPDTLLTAEVYISPEDIGLLWKGMPARFQIDAYNYNQWGTATGSITSISDDVIMHDGQPLFRVLCSIDQAYLELQNGFRGDIRKGMTLQARFIVTRRSLFQLLYDKVDDWLNPVRSEQEHASRFNQM